MPIAGTSFPLPAANVTVNAVFEHGHMDSLIASGINALLAGDFDAAVRAFENAYLLDSTNQEALLYSSLARLASIAVDDNVRALVSDRLGIRGFPGTINALVNPDWLETYTEEWFRWEIWCYNHNTWAWWVNENNTGFFEWAGLPPKSGYYVQVLGSTWEVTWEFVSDVRRYDIRDSLFPGLDAPAWLEDTGVFQNTLTSAGLRSPATFPLLMFANLIDRNTNGLNDLLDALLSSVFGASFEEAARRAGAMTGTVMLNEDLLMALGINDIFEGELVAIGKAELNVLFSLMRIVRGSLEWIAAYDWNTDLDFLANGQLWDDWARIENIDLGPASLPLRNNFLRDRHNGMMARSKASFTQAIDGLIWSYDFWIGSASNLPPAYRDILREFQWVRSGLSELRAAINNGGHFYLRDARGPDTYANTPTGALFGINMGAFFTPGHFAIDNLLSTQGVGGNMAPQFYGWQDRGSQAVRITSLAELRQHRVIGFRLNMRPVQGVVVLGLEIDETYVDLQIMPPAIAEIIWNWYH